MVIGRFRIALRIGLAYLILVEAVQGVWALGFPRSFYDDFPLPGHDWVAMLPPYNRHLITDYGELSLALTFGFVVAAVTLNRLLLRTVLVGYLFYSVAHLAFHVEHLAGFPLGDAVVQTILLALGVALPLALLALTKGEPGRWGRSRPRRSPDSCP